MLASASRARRGAPLAACAPPHAAPRLRARQPTRACSGARTAAKVATAGARGAERATLAPVSVLGATDGTAVALGEVLPEQGRCICLLLTQVRNSG